MICSQLSIEAVRQSLTLLKNTPGRAAQANTLPLTWMASGANILVIGPAATSRVPLCGGWTYHWQGACSDSEFSRGSSIAQAVTTRAAVNVSGCLYWRLCSDLAYQDITVTVMEGCDFSDTPVSPSTLADISQAAHKATVVIFAAGEAPESESVGNINDLRSVGQLCPSTAF